MFNQYIASPISVRSNITPRISPIQNRQINFAMVQNQPQMTQYKEKDLKLNIDKQNTPIKQQLLQNNQNVNLSNIQVQNSKYISNYSSQNNNNCNLSKDEIFDFIKQQVKLEIKNNNGNINQELIQIIQKQNQDFQQNLISVCSQIDNLKNYAEQQIIQIKDKINKQDQQIERIQQTFNINQEIELKIQKTQNDQKQIFQILNQITNQFSGYISDINENVYQGSKNFNQTQDRIKQLEQNFNNTYIKLQQLLEGNNQIQSEINNQKLQNLTETKFQFFNNHFKSIKTQNSQINDIIDQNENYQIDNEGYLMSEDNQYIYDQDGQKIKIDRFNQDQSNLEYHVNF